MAWWKGDSRIAFVFGRGRGERSGGDGKLVTSWKAEPGFVDTCETAEAVLSLHDAELEEVIEVSEAPGDETKACDTEKGVQDLRIDFDPDAAGGVDVVAVFTLVIVRAIAHGAGGVAEKEEEHATPCDDVETVEDDEETHGGNCESTEGFEADDRGFAPRVFGREGVSIWVNTFVVGGGFFC